MKKLFYIILFIAVVGGGIYAWFYFSDGDVKSNNVESFLNSTGTQPMSQLPVNYTIADTFPKTETISIGTGNGAVEVKNFYKTLVDTEEGFIIMADNENYQISYDRSTSKFYVDLKTETASQQKSESELLNILGIGQQDACKLNVIVIQPEQTTGARLSFCANKVK